MAERNDISDLLAFIGREGDWRERLQEVVAEHLMPALEEFGIDHDGLIDLLDWAVERKIGLAVVSNAPRLNVIDMLAQIGVADYFHTMVIGGELERGKPDPLPYLTGLERLGVPADKAMATCRVPMMADRRGAPGCFSRS